MSFNPMTSSFGPVITDEARGAVTSSPTYRYVYADCLGYAGYVDEPILRHTGTTTTLPTTGDNALYYHRNQQYSIVGLTNAAGTLVERYTYSAYGTLGIYAANGTARSSSTYANRYTYTGREWDVELRLYHFRARWYDPATGGFVSRDLLGYVDGMSLYRGYFGVKGLDPLGLRKVCCKMGYMEGGTETWIRETECPDDKSAEYCCGTIQPILFGYWRVFTALDAPCKKKEEPTSPAAEACFSAGAFFFMCAIPAPEPTTAGRTPVAGGAGTICMAAGAAIVLGVTIAHCTRDLGDEMPDVEVISVAGYKVLKCGLCNFYLSWCLWGTDPNNTKKGRIWTRWGGTSDDCFDCYNECIATGSWPHGRCLPNGDWQGPTYPNGIWP